MAKLIEIIFEIEYSMSKLLTNIYSGAQVERSTCSIDNGRSQYFIVERPQYNDFKFFFKTRCDETSVPSLSRMLENKNCIITEYVSFNRDDDAEIFLRSIGFVGVGEIVRMKFNGQYKGFINPYTITDCRQEDLDQIEHIICAKFDSTTEGILHLSEISQAVNARDIKIIKKDDNVIGMYWAQRKPGIFELRYLYVSPEQRGGGIGQSLLADYLEKAVSEKNRCLLWVKKCNKVALSLYEKHGFNVDGLKCFVFLRKG